MRKSFSFLVFDGGHSRKSELAQEVENCNKSRKAFSAIVMAGYSFSTSIQNASKFNSACLSFSILSLATLTSSYSSFKVNCPWHGSNSTNGFLTQLYWSTDIDGNYLLRLFNRASMVTSALFLFSYWPPAEPLPGAHGTLQFCRTPVEKHCFTLWCLGLSARAPEYQKLTSA